MNANPEGKSGAPDPRHAKCSICSQLEDCNYAMQVIGREAQDTFLPKIGERLKHVRQLKPRPGVGQDRCRVRELKQCPECGTYYQYRSDYEYLATGSEDEQWLERLSGEAGVAELNSPPVK